MRSGKIRCNSHPDGPGLRPVIGSRPKTLILGSYPSVLSLSHQEYYGNPKNQFWQILEASRGIDHALPYADRVAALKRQGIALWDVICSCSREGSGDGSIRDPVFNDLEGLLSSYPTIRTIILNGTLAGKHFTALTIPTGDRTVHILPSTSPANARITLKEKIHRWKAALDVT